MEVVYKFWIEWINNYSWLWLLLLLLLIDYLLYYDFMLWLTGWWFD
jgi:hypothetical protein